MITKGFKPMGWVAGVAAAALGCYMLSLNVAAERAELESVERRIIAAKQDIRQLQTELGTRGRLAQLDRWNAEVLALSAPGSAQFLDNAVMLARFDQQQPTIEARAKVHLASLETTETRKAPEAKVITASYEPAPALDQAAQPLVRRASLIVTEDKPLPKFKPAGLLDAELIAEIRDTAKVEKKQSEGGVGGQ